MKKQEKSKKKSPFQKLVSRFTRASPDGLSDKQARSMVDLLGYRNLDKRGILYLKDGSVARYLKVKTTDLFSLDWDGKQKFIDDFTDFNRTYTQDYKIVTLSARIDTSPQQKYWRHLRKLLRQNVRTQQDLARIDLINRIYLSRMVGLERDEGSFNDVKYYIEIFAPTVKNLDLNTKSAQYADPGLLGLEPISYNETINVLFRQNNLNSK